MKASSVSTHWPCGLTGIELVDDKGYIFVHTKRRFIIIRNRVVEITCYIED